MSGMATCVSPMLSSMSMMMSRLARVSRVTFGVVQTSLCTVQTTLDATLASARAATLNSALEVLDTSLTAMNSFLAVRMHQRVKMSQSGTTHHGLSVLDAALMADAALVGLAACKRGLKVSNLLLLASHGTQMRSASLSGSNQQDESQKNTHLG